MATFSELQTEVLGNLIDMPTFIQTQVPKYINRAITRAQGKHNFLVMQTEAAFVTATGTRVLGAVPANWKEWRGKSRYEETTGMVRKLTIAITRDDVRKYRSVVDIGFPQFLLRSEQTDAGTSNFEVYPLPDGSSDYSDGQYRVFIPYWRYTTPLSNPGDSNWFTNTDPSIDYIVKQATSMGFYASEDETRALNWVQLSAVDWKDLILIDKYAQLSGADTLVPHEGADEPMLNN